MEKSEITERAREMARYVGYDPADAGYDLALERVQMDLDSVASARRERIATAVLSGFAASAKPGDEFKTIAIAAVGLADTLIDELDKEAP